MTEKLDGENTTLYADHIHARSLDSRHHASRSWVKSLWSTIKHELGDLRLCGENLYAWHSIFYTELPSYFFAFGIYNSQNICLSWDETAEFCQLLGIQTVPLIYRGAWDQNLIQNLWTGKGAFPTFVTDANLPSYPKDFRSGDAEGYVVRLARSFPYDQFKNSVAKHVRKNFITTKENWMQRSVIANMLAKNPP